jgi:hypothetical protein
LKELLPFAIGLAAGLCLLRIERRRLRVLATIVVALAGGVCASAINGELVGAVWPLFVSLDAVLVYAGVGSSAAIAMLLARRRAMASASRGGRARS